MNFSDIAVHPANILLPAGGIRPETWACVACDQYTSQPDYWEKVSALVGTAPSTLNLMLPECYLSESASRVPQIHASMKAYLESGMLTSGVSQGFVLCERTIASGTRLGLVCAIDLEDYDFAKGSLPLVRPTEQTIASRLPARLAIRRGAPVELGHIMILIDDPDRLVLEPLQKKKAALRKLYDFDLMMNGGHLAGWAVESKEDLDAVSSAMHTLKNRLGPDPMLLAVGDGNHSLATAKAYWNEIRGTLSEKEREDHPARFALCEIVNIHDEALLFEPIHRVITGVSSELLLQSWADYASAHGMTLSDNGEGHSFTAVTVSGDRKITVGSPEDAIPTETIQKFLDSFLSEHPEAEIDYIHGDDSLRSLVTKDTVTGFLLPAIDKTTFFEDVLTLGVLPRKTFSMGEADEKRFYMESKQI